MTRAEDAAAPHVQIIPLEVCSAPGEGFHLPSFLSHLDMSEGESSRGSGRCEKARPRRKTGRQSAAGSGRPEGEGASCEAICSGRADRRRRRRDVLYSRLFPEEAPGRFAARWTLIGFDYFRYSIAAAAATDVAL